MFNLRYPLVVLAAILILSRQAHAFSGFQRSLNDRPWAITLVEQPRVAGQVAQRFELRPGDCGQQPGWSDCQQDRERVEFSQLRPYIPLNQTVWVSFSLMLDPSWQDQSPVTTTLGQFHHRDSGTPALLFVQKNGHYWLRIESARSLYPGRDHYLLLPLSSMLGQWNHLVVQARFTDQADGLIRVWVNGQLRVDHRGATTLGQTPVFFKYGIYRSFVSRRPLRAVGVAYWDEVHSGTDRSQVDLVVNRQLNPQN